ncbi:MAG: hypothetical protein ACPGMR_03310 [Pontibacterium sp.]
MFRPHRSAEALLAEHCELGARVQYSSKLNTNHVVANNIQSGIILSAIDRLTPPLRLWGNWLYAPEDFVSDTDEEALWKMFAVLVGVDDEESELWYLTHAAMRCYQERARSRPKGVCVYQKPAQIRDWLFEYHGVNIESRRWKRRYGVFWDKLLSIMDDLDRRALSPVASALDKMLDEPACYVTWGDHLVVM